MSGAGRSLVPDLQFHHRLLTDSGRMEAYRKAISEVVTPGDNVLDVGCGTGILSFFACQAGARKVYAVERSDIIFLARKLANHNGFGDRIEFLHSDVFAIDLADQVDSIISELFSRFLFGQEMQRILIHSRDRFLRPNGKMVPMTMRLFLAPMELSADRVRFPPRDAYALDFSPANAMLVKQIHEVACSSESLLGQGVKVFEVNLQTIVAAHGLETRTRFRVNRQGTLYGMVGWFEVRLSSSVILSTSPHTGAKARSWSHSFFPARRPIALKQGDQVEFAISAVPLLGGDVLYEWSFSVPHRRREPPSKNSRVRQLGENSPLRRLVGTSLRASQK